MKSLLLKFANNLLSKDEMKALKGGNISSCETTNCSNPLIPQDSGHCYNCNGGCRVSYTISSKTYTYEVNSTSCTS